MSKNKFYAYYLTETNEKGITSFWSDCEKIIKGKSAKYKGFKTQQEASEWLSNGAKYEYNTDKTSSKAYKKVEFTELKEGIYFDAGTGRGIGVEVRLTNEKGENLLHLIAPKEYINEFGNYLAPKGSTNNYGELFGCYTALKLALSEGVKEIFGDSKLILDYWSKGHAKINELPSATVKLIGEVSKLRAEYERSGGKLTHVSGDINPADLGFHR
jgi:ribonuclease HI